MTYQLKPRMAGAGFWMMGTAAEALGARKLVYLNVGGQWLLADADAAVSMPVIGITQHAIVSGQKGVIFFKGFIGDVSWTWTLGGKIYADTTAGELNQIAPVGSGDQVQEIGVAYTATLIYFNPSVRNLTEGVCRIATGTYTGDGAVAQAITGVGFRSRAVLICYHKPVVGFEGQMVYFKDDTMGTRAMEVAGPNYFDDRVNSLDNDGFTVDDAGADSHPNTNGAVYGYVAWG